MVAVFIVVLVLIGIAIWYSLNSHSSQNTANPTVPTPEQTESIVPTQQAAVTSTQPSISPTVTQEPNIKVTAPGENAKVSSPFVVTGEARVFENTFQIRLNNPSTGKILFTDTVTANAPDVGQYGGFSKTVSFDSAGLNNGDALLLEVFQNSPKDGSEIDKVSVHIVYKNE
jgi:hypothetical protein